MKTQLQLTAAVTAAASLATLTAPASAQETCSCSPTAYSFAVRFDGSCDASYVTGFSGDGDAASGAVGSGVEGSVCFYGEGDDPADVDAGDIVFGGPIKRMLGLGKGSRGLSKEEDRRWRRALKELDLSPHVAHAERMAEKMRREDDAFARRRGLLYRQGPSGLDIRPRMITSVTFLEADTTPQLSIMNQDSTYFNTTLDDGDIITFDSISAGLDPSMPLEDQADLLPGGVMMILFGTNDDGVLVQNTVAWGYDTGYCDGQPLSVGDKIGWVELEGFESPMVEFCPAVTASPTTSPVEATTTTTEATEPAATDPAATEAATTEEPAITETVATEAPSSKSAKSLPTTTTTTTEAPVEVEDAWMYPAKSSKSKSAKALFAKSEHAEHTHPKKSKSEKSAKALFAKSEHAEHTHPKKSKSAKDAKAETMSMPEAKATKIFKAKSKGHKEKSEGDYSAKSAKAKGEYSAKSAKSEGEWYDDWWYASDDEEHVDAKAGKMGDSEYSAKSGKGMLKSKGYKEMSMKSGKAEKKGASSDYHTHPKHTHPKKSAKVYKTDMSMKTAKSAKGMFESTSGSAKSYKTDAYMEGGKAEKMSMDTDGFYEAKAEKMASGSHSGSAKAEKMAGGSHSGSAKSEKMEDGAYAKSEKSKSEKSHPKHTHPKSAKAYDTDMSMFGSKSAKGLLKSAKSYKTDSSMDSTDYDATEAPSAKSAKTYDPKAAKAYDYSTKSAKGLFKSAKMHKSEKAKSEKSEHEHPKHTHPKKGTDASAKSEKGEHEHPKHTHPKSAKVFGTDMSMETAESDMFKSAKTYKTSKSAKSYEMDMTAEGGTDASAKSEKGEHEHPKHTHPKSAKVFGTDMSEKGTYASAKSEKGEHPKHTHPKSAKVFGTDMSMDTGESAMFKSAKTYKTFKSAKSYGTDMTAGSADYDGTKAPSAKAEKTVDAKAEKAKSEKGMFKSAKSEKAKSEKAKSEKSEYVHPKHTHPKSAKVFGTDMSMISSKSMKSAKSEKSSKSAKASGLFKSAKSYKTEGSQDVTESPPLTGWYSAKSAKEEPVEDPIDTSPGFMFRVDGLPH